MGSIDKLVTKVEKHLGSYQPASSLLHGDLWSGNAGFTDNGQTPVTFDPASYYGSREVDLVMTEMFGGFPDTFYQGYASIWPLEDGYIDRKPVYDLYQLLNHHIIFHSGDQDSSYLNQAKVIFASL